jgi:hypothetical protein
MNPSASCRVNQFFFAIILMWYTRNVYIYFINWTVHMSDNLPERVQILGHVHIIRCLVVGNIFRLETCMNGLVKVPPYSKLNFQGKFSSPKTGVIPTTRNLQICVHVYHPRHCCEDWLTFGCFVPMIADHDLMKKSFGPMIADHDLVKKRLTIIFFKYNYLKYALL